MNWEQVCTDSALQNLPYKIEINKWGQIIMSPASNRHGMLQMKIGFLLISLTKEQGKVISECSVETHHKTKVADIAWCSSDFIKKHGITTPFPKAPEICIEIISPSNTSEEMREKRRLYFKAGAKEVWVCNEDGNITFYNQNKKLRESEMIPEFPEQIEV